MSPALTRRLIADRNGAAAVELALLMPVLLAMVLGTMEVGRMAWTQAALTHAVQEASRCAAVRKTTCPDAAETKKFAAAQVKALNIPVSAFTATTPACGQQVAATLNYGFLLYAIAPSAPAITARACHA